MSDVPPFPRARLDSEERPRRKEGERVRVETRWRELWSWLGSALDDFGLDAPLYARCLLSILRQSPSALQGTAPTLGRPALRPLPPLHPQTVLLSPPRYRTHSGRPLYARCLLSILRQSPSALQGTAPTLDAPLYARCLLSILRQSPSALQDSDEESSEEEGEVLPSLRRVTASHTTEAGTDRREAALLECLSTAELPGPAMVAMVSELLRRYRDLEAIFTRSTSRPNDSIDSGVCPSPETADSFQNYDEAFPPLLDLGGDEFLGKPPPLPVKEKPEELLSPDTAPQPGEIDASFLPELEEPTEEKKKDWGMGWQQGTGVSGPRSMPKLSSLSSGLPFTTQWTRPGTEQRRALVSCPQMEWWGSSRSGQPSGPDLYNVKEVGGLAQLTANPSHHHFSATPPTFVVPKFRQTQGAVTSVKVGSCPSKLEYGYSGPPGAQNDLWTWLSAQTASVHPHNLTNHPPPPSPGLPDIDSSYDFPSLRTINEDPQPRFPPPINSQQHWPQLSEQEGRQIFPAQSDPVPIPLEAWETVDTDQLDLGNFSFGLDSQADYYLEPPSMEEESGSPPGFVVPRLAQMAGTDTVLNRPSNKAGFQSIRSESMEFAFVPPHRHPSPGSYAVEYAHGEEWYVLRDHHPPSNLPSRSRTRQSSACTDFTEAAPAKRRRPSGQSETLPLKFQAVKPAKMVQTEPQESLTSSFDDRANNNTDHHHFNNQEHWERWRDEGREWEEGDLGYLDLLNRPRQSAFADSEGRKIVSLGAGSSIWEVVPRTCVSEWGAGLGSSVVESRRDIDTESERADDDLLLSLVGSISVTAPLQ